MASSSCKTTQKRKLWSDESMAAAVVSVKDGRGLREASRLYNVPVETLRRRVIALLRLTVDQDRLLHLLRMKSCA